MSQIILVPFSDQEIGQGFNFDSREAVGTGLATEKQSEDPVADGQVVHTLFQIVTTQESLMESLGISASADIRYGLFSGGAKMDFASSHAKNSFSSTISGRCEVHNAIRRGHGFRLTREAEELSATGDPKAFKTAFGDMFVRSLKTGGELCVVAQVTSVSETHQSKMAASLHGEYNSLAAAGSFKASFETAMTETDGRSEVTVFMSQAGGVGGQASFTGADATKILERLSQFPQSVHEHPVAYEAELATYDTIPIHALTPEEREDRNIVLADCLAQKSKYLSGLADLQFLQGPTATSFFDNLPTLPELATLEAQYRGALNGLMAHAIKVSTGKMEPPQLFQANPAPPPLNFKRHLVSSDEKANFASKGQAVAQSDPRLSAVRDLQMAGARQHGFDIGVGATGPDSVWGPGKQQTLNSLSVEEQIGFRNAAAFIMGRNGNVDGVSVSVLAANGADIAEADPELAAVRTKETSGLYWLGFDVGTGIFADRPKGLGHTSVGLGAGKIRAIVSEGERVLLFTDQASRGFDASVAFNLARRQR